MSRILREIFPDVPDATIQTVNHEKNVLQETRLASNVVGLVTLRSFAETEIPVHTTVIQRNDATLLPTDQFVSTMTPMTNDF